jgi:integral membrane protein (TIGR01906 family)
LNLIRHIAALLFIVALPVALLTTNIRIAANEPRLYEYAIDHYDAVETTGIERAELLRASDELRAYFRSDSDEPVFVRVEQDGEPVALFSQRETRHLQDVRTAFQYTFRVQEASVLFVLAYVVIVFIWAQEGSLRSLASQLGIAALVGGVAVVGVGAVALAGFDQFWERFHGVLFTNDFWQLDPSRDHLIQMFPEAFWQDVSLWIGLATLGELAVLGAIGVLYLGVTRRSTVSFALPRGVQQSRV